VAIGDPVGPDRRPAVHHTHRLELTVTAAPLVLDRIVSVCRARRCAITALRFEAADRHRPGRVLVTIEADAAQARVATQRLSGMPGVLAVAHRGAGERAQGHAGSVTERARATAGRA
jgi:acetolactate synthase regulatory subunit